MHSTHGCALTLFKLVSGDKMHMISDFKFPMLQQLPLLKLFSRSKSIFTGELVITCPHCLNCTYYYRGLKNVLPVAVWPKSRDGGNFVLFHGILCNIIRLQRILPPKCHFRSSKKCKFRQQFCHKSRILPVFRHPKMRPFQQCITVTAVNLFYEVLP